MRGFFVGLNALFLIGCTQANTQAKDTTDPQNARQDPAAAKLLSAFFGLDNGLPNAASFRICRGAGGQDGMPVIFSQEINVETMQAGDFRVRSRSGKEGAIKCVTLEPAKDPGELRTALLVGELGDAAHDPPVTVEIVGNVLSTDGTLNFKGASIEVTPLAPGPSLVFAEVVPEAEWELKKQGGPWGTGSGCPEGTRQVIRATWAGGVTKASSGEEVDDTERAQYKVELKTEEGSTTVVPFALGDLDDGDNNHELCLDVTGTPVSLSFPAGYLADPNKDPNPDTRIVVSGK